MTRGENRGSSTTTFGVDQDVGATNYGKVSTHRGGGRDQANRNISATIDDGRTVDNDAAGGNQKQNRKPNRKPNRNRTKNRIKNRTKNGLLAEYGSDTDTWEEDDDDDDDTKTTIWKEGSARRTITKSGTITWR